MLEIRPLSAKIGAEVAGVDLKTLGDEDFAKIYDAFLDHIVLVFRGQGLAMEDFLEHGRRYGPIRQHIVRKSRHPVFPDLMVMDNKIVDTKKGAEKNPSVNLVKRGAVWHTDTSYDYVTAKATQLYARAIPSRGGDTLFSNAYAIYDALPEVLKRRIDGLSAAYKYGGRLKREVQLLEEEDQVRPAAVHALVRVHPETGRKTIYFNPGQVMEIVGLDKSESDDLIAELITYAESPDGDYRHEWQVGDLIVWDNRCLVHAATGDYPPEERRIHWRASMMEHDWTPAAEAEIRLALA